MEIYEERTTFILTYSVYTYLLPEVRRMIIVIRTPLLIRE